MATCTRQYLSSCEKLPSYDHKLADQVNILDKLGAFMGKLKWQAGDAAPNCQEGFAAVRQI